MKKIVYPYFTGYSYFFKITLLLLLNILLLTTRVSAQNELNVVSDKWLEYTDASNALYKHLSGQAYTLLKQRADLVAGIKNPGQWQQRQQEIKILIEIVGPFPEKSPLNAKTVKTIKKEDYTVEHIIFESQPGFYVTSSLYLPAGIVKGNKLPVIIYCSGHTEAGYRSPVYQNVILNLVKKGFAVYAFDPVGQGERLEYFDPGTGKSIVGGPTMEHSYPGAQAFINGSSQAKYMIWDGIRAVDFLLTRKEIDPARIGITGRSGGGTQSSQIAAFDDRIYAAAPENYITNYTRLLQSIGPQDAEQNLHNMIGRGLDHADLLIVRAPKPTMMITTTDDMFSIQGAMETEKEVLEIFRAYGKEDNFSRVEDNAPHASTLKNRESMYAFFQKHLNNPGNPDDEKTEPLSAEELQVTKTGQISTSLKGETVFSLNKKEAQNHEAGLKQLREDPSGFTPESVSMAIKLSGYVEPSSVEEPVFTGRIVRDTYTIDKFFVKGEGDYIIPYLLFKPQKPDGRAILYLDPSGKSGEAVQSEIVKFLTEGITVLAPDLIGTGEMGPGKFQGDAYFNGVSHNLWYAALLTGRSIAGIQAGDVVRLVKLLKKQNFDNIIGLARKEMSPVLLHAAAFSAEISAVILIEPYSSYFSLVSSRFYNPHFILSAVPGAIGNYDLPDLAASLAPRKLFIAGTTDGNAKINDTAIINNDHNIIKSYYSSRNAAGNLMILSEGSNQKIYELLIEFIR
jgi:hypothetical protein